MSPVLAAKILQGRLAMRDDNPRVVPRYAWGVDRNCGVGGTTDHVHAFKQRNAPSLQGQPQPRASVLRARRAHIGSDFADEAVPEPIDGPYERGVRSGVAERTTDLGCESGEVRLVDERRRP